MKRIGRMPGIGRRTVFAIAIGGRGMIENPHAELSERVVNFGDGISAFTVEMNQVAEIHLGIRLQLDGQKSLDSLAGKRL
jgi:hypothetical protein